MNAPCVVAKGGHFYYSYQLQCCAALSLWLKRRKLLCVCMDVFEHAKIAWWQHCNADTLAYPEGEGCVGSNPPPLNV